MVASGAVRGAPLHRRARLYAASPCARVCFMSDWLSTWQIEGAMPKVLRLDPDGASPPAQLAKVSE